jgi:ArsR family transcriptional regulator, arsenate/arsenite/antimonite-responsive transcriptional repressor
MKTIEMPSQVDEKLLEMLRAVANPMRYRILQILAERGECQCGPLGDQLPIAASTLSQHLKVLREAGLIDGNVDGPSICYCRNEANIVWLKEHIQRL